MIPNLQIPHWDTTQSDGGAPSPFSINAVDEDFDMPIHLFSSDHFRMFQFKVRDCPRGRSHDWTECPYAHPGEKARRRDPRKYHYSGTACPEFRRGNCMKGDSCQFAHGVFECWLHPSRYRTQLCKDGTSCRRRVCFFAHTMDQLRVLTHGSPESFVTSPTSVLNSSLCDTPPVSPGNLREIVSSMRNVKLEVEDVSSGSTRGSKMGRCCVFGSTRGGFMSMPSTLNRCEEEPAMERVESGRDLRAKIYAKLSRENSIGRNNAAFSYPIPDVGWVSELIR
ncbi:zinc finger CCCH domain-containing protein 20-like [Gastrolobium bilobum]|uniref:zinc finger CCCH domain-containing protein 20-like n=1 Tax=Gastrolobium bilobum TaxID=150636 RepID=UPI002AB1090A|nr:zinc finger CCCH domain-containing protein 20-like [Gastrolobium bilobum]